MAAKRIHSVRVACENWMDEARLDALCALLEKRDVGVGQVSLFTAGVHTPLPLDEIERRSSLMRERMAYLRARGFSAGINILATIGHHNEDLDNCFDGPYARMTNIEGQTVHGSFCLNDDGYIRDYVAPVYRMLAEAEPDYIWIDDDIRYGHMPIGNGCYCDHCIALLNTELGLSLSREALRERLNGGDIPLRRAWLRQKSQAIERLFAVIGRTVRAVDERIQLGFMTGERYAEGYDFAAWARALSDGGKYQIMWRPGGGAYTDYSFDAIVEKSEQIGRQTAYLPDYVTQIQSEIENFPYQLIKKTPVSTAAEVVLHMFNGCSGAALNILPSETGEPLSLIEPHLEAISRVNPFTALIHDKLKGLKPEGIHTGWRIDSMACAHGGEWAQSYGGALADYAREIFDFGLPQAYDRDKACVTMLTAHSIDVMTDDELKKILSGGVYMDVHALDDLNARGFGAFTGFRKGQSFPVDAREMYTDISINSGFVGGLRNGRQAFHPDDSYGLIPSDKRAVSASQLVDYHMNTLADCAMGLYENALGGRVAVGGYYPFSWVSDTFKTKQLRRLFLWLSRETLPAYVETYGRLRLYAFRRGETRLIALFNPTNQPLDDIIVGVNAGLTAGTYYTQDGRSYTLESLYATDAIGWRHFQIPYLGAFEGALIEI